MSGAPGFADHFSASAAGYAAFRPTYPPALFAWLASLLPGDARRARAWDCATGSGQAARGLAAHVAHVVGTDASVAQLAHAAPHPRVSYAAATAERSALAAGCVQLVTVAQALHWFDAAAFHAEARRVLAPGGVVAAWSYGDLTLDDPALDAVVHALAHGTLAGHWPPERRLVDEGYRTIPFPHREVAAPAFALEHRWTLPQLAGYLRSWSAVARWQAAHGGADPVADAERALAAGWGDGGAAARPVRWPLALRVGYVASAGAGDG